MARPTLTDLNPIELNYYPFMIGLDICNGSRNVLEDISMKICILSETKDVNVKVFNMITTINEAKTFVKHLSCNSKCKFNSTVCHSNEK